MGGQIAGNKKWPGAIFNVAQIAERMATKGQA